MKVLAAFSAAASRVGLTSFDAIEPEWSSTSTSEAPRIGRRWLIVGPRQANHQHRERRQQRGDRELAPPASARCSRRRRPQRRRGREAHRIGATFARRGQRWASSCQRQISASASSQSGSARLIRSGVPARAANPGRWRAARDGPRAGAARRRRSARRSRSSAAKRSRNRAAGAVRPGSARRSRGRPAPAVPTAGSSASRGSPTSIATTAWRSRSAPSGRSQSCWSRKSEITTTSPGCVASLKRARQRRAERVLLADARPARRPPRAACAARSGPAWSRAAAAPAGPPPRQSDHPDAARPAQPQPREHQRRALGDVGLQPPRGPERHRRREVEHDPGGQRPLGHVHAHMQRAGARAGGGVDVAHVVTGLVGAQLRELGAETDAGWRAGCRAACARSAG